MLSVLTRIFVSPFYVRNAGTFGVVFYFAFGFMRPMDHEALIAATLGSPLLLSSFILIWTLYAARTVGFIRGQLAAPEHLFVQTFRLLPAPARWFYWLVLFVQLLAPVLGYAGWMAIRAVHYQTWGALATIGLTVLGLAAGSVGAADFRLRRPSPDTLHLPRLNIRLRYELFFPTYWLRHEPLSFLLTKLISCGLLAGVCRLYPTDDYDQRLLLIGLMLAVITHSQVGRQLNTFEQRYLLLLPNLPFSPLQRLGQYVLTYGLIWLPELLILFRNAPSNVGLSYIAGLWLTGWGWLLLMHGLGYGRDIPSERWQTIVFAAFIGGLLAIMFGFPMVAWALGGWSAAFALGWKKPLTV